MNFIERTGMLLTDSVEFIVDKNRQYAQLNRLNAIISNETDAINRAYIALGKYYCKTLEDKADETDVEMILNSIRVSKLRLKKARARYEYVLRYGVPKITMSYGPDAGAAEIKDASSEVNSAAKNDTLPSAVSDDEDQDITIAYADPCAEDAEKQAEEVSETAEAAEEKDPEAAEETASEAAEEVPAKETVSEEPAEENVQVQQTSKGSKKRSSRRRKTGNSSL